MDNLDPSEVWGRMGLRVVAHMLCRNERDIIDETIREVFRWVDTLIVLDGMSDDGTRQALEGLVKFYARQGKTLRVVSEEDPGGRFQDDIRKRLLELTAPYRPDWVLSIDADEIYDSYVREDGVHVDLFTAIALAEEAGANVVRCQAPQFWFTLDDLRKGRFWESDVTPIQYRRRWYSWGHMLTPIWKTNAAHYYPAGVQKRTPELPGRDWRQWQIAGPLYPICKHYTHRTVSQIVKRSLERQERGGRKAFGKYFLPYPIVDEQVAGLYRLDPLKPQWNMTRNHEALHRYLAEGH